MDSNFGVKDPDTRDLSASPGKAKGNFLEDYSDDSEQEEYKAK